MKPIWLYTFLILLVSVAFAVAEFHSTTSINRTLFMISPALMALAFSPFDPRRALRTLGWKPNFRYWMKIIFILAPFFTALLAVAFLAGHVSLNEKSLNKFFTLSTALSLFVGILLNTGEEAGWRGYLFPSLVREQGWWRAVFLTSLVWWLWHVPMMAVLQLKMFGEIQYQTQLLQLASLLPVTVVFGIWMKESNSFWAIGFAHQLINFANKWFLGMEHSEKVPVMFATRDYIQIYSTESGWLGIAAMTILATGLYCKRSP